MRLDQLIQSAIDDPSKEDAVFAQLLTATLYVHAPKNRTGERLSIVQFRTPQGVMAIPVFTDMEKAAFAGRNNVKIVAVTGKELFVATIGATVVINPNDAWCILYPEEIAHLVEGNTLARTPEQITLDTDISLSKPTEPDAALVEVLASSLASIPHATDAWLVETTPAEPGHPGGYIVMVAAEAPHHERIARSLTIAMSEVGRRLGKTVDVAFIEPGEKQEAWLRENKDCLIFRREWTMLQPCIHEAHSLN